MNDLIIYLISVSAGIGLFTLPYLVFLRKDPNLVLKRIFLISAILFSWLVPVLPTGHWFPVPVNSPSIFLDPGIRAATAAGETTVPGPGITFSWYRLTGMIYLAGVIFLFIRNIALIARLSIQRRPEIAAGDLTYTHGENVFAFLRKIYLPENFTRDEETELILIHERAHIRQRHYIDLIMLEFTIILTWFNPFTWLISGMIKENHEHLADREVLQQGISPVRYRAQLLNRTFGVRAFRLGHAFNHSITKKRFDMMKNLKYSGPGVIKYIILIPAVLFTLSFITTGQMQKLPVKGKVILSDSGKPAEGAAVVIAGTTTGTVAGSDGQFSLETGGNVKLAISYVGYASQLLNVTPGETVNIELEPTRTELDLKDLPDEEKSVKKNEALQGDDVYYVVEEMPEFPGGNKALKDYIITHLKYPGEAQARGLEGVAYVGLTISPEGKITDIHIIRSSDPVFDTPALSVFSGMPDWKPGKQRGHSVATNLTIPVHFELNQDKSLDK